MSPNAAETSVRTQIVVEAPIERAFSVFTEEFGSFKPPEHNLLEVDCPVSSAAHRRPPPRRRRTAVAPHSSAPLRLSN